jgi:cobalt-precorrin 5A hydrolase
MKLAVISFTKEGSLLCRKLVSGLHEQGNDCCGYAKQDYLNLRICETPMDSPESMLPLAETVGAWTGRMFDQMDGLIYIGACGIAVRAIAPHLKDKFTDPAVVVVDELHHHAISLLSGHVGGANELTRKVAEILGAEPVITTATDVHGKLAIDVWAKEHDLTVTNRQTAKEIAMRILEGKKVGFTIDPKVEKWYRNRCGAEKNIVPENCCNSLCKTNVVVSCRANFDSESVKKLPWSTTERNCESPETTETLVLSPKLLTVGIGCRKGTDAEQIERTVRQVFEKYNLSFDAIHKLVSIDLKKDEEGIIEFASAQNLPFETYSAEQLQSVPGDFTDSEFVKKTTGVGNICERAAVLAAGDESELLVKKQAEQGVTVAVALQVNL